MKPSLRLRAAPGTGVVTLCLAAGLSLSALGGANPYQGIFERNAFHLRPPSSGRVEAPPAPLPKVRLTGITTILPGKRALLVVDFPTKPQERPKEESYILAEGQRAGPIEVLAIDEKTAHVKVDDAGTVTNLTFEKVSTPQRPAPAPVTYRWGKTLYPRANR